MEKKPVAAAPGSDKVERVIGFEPMICGFADRRLGPLGYTRKNWYTRRDSNSQYPVSKTGAFADLATRAR